MSCTSWRMNEVDLRPRPAPLLEAILVANYLRKRAVRNSSNILSKTRLPDVPIGLFSARTRTNSRV